MKDELWEGGFLRAGWHDANIRDARDFTTPKGTEGVVFTVATEDGQTAKAEFYLTEKAMRRFASFLKAAGITREGFRAYNEQNPAHHRKMIGKDVKVLVELVPSYKDPSKSYPEVTDWLPIADATPDHKPAPQHVAPVEEDKGDEVPF